MTDYPAASAQLPICFFAKNQAYAGDQDIVTASDELALIPPVSGGQPSLYEITHSSIDVVSVTSKGESSQSRRFTCFHRYDTRNDLWTANRPIGI